MAQATRRRISEAERDWWRASTQDRGIRTARAALRYHLRTHGDPSPQVKNAQERVMAACDAFNLAHPYPQTEETL